ncbi:MAG: GNAT family N-acetyltransferase [Maritimibacter sp.]
MSADLIIAPARPEDAPAIGLILSAWIDETPWIPRVHSHDDEQGFGRMMVERGWTTVARRDGEVLGFLSRDETEVHALYLRADARGQGVGKALLDSAKSASARLELWTFQQNTRAQQFYLREGFREVGRTNGTGNDEKLPDIRYVWGELE